jgi:hypothetical protein
VLRRAQNPTKKVIVSQNSGRWPKIFPEIRSLSEVGGKGDNGRKEPEERCHVVEFKEKDNKGGKKDNNDEILSGIFLIVISFFLY